MDKLKMMSMDKVSENIEKMKALFPNCVTEVKRGEEVEYAIDFDVLKQELSKDLVDEREERYQMTWPDKKKSVVLANSPINKTLRPCREESVDFDNTENLYIEGDNLEVLKLLQETYLGKIKMIYIDPPYNTGKDSFVYNDAYSMEKEEFLSAGGYYDEDGNRVIDVKENNESNGRFHTDWLNMIYPRLRLARDLLSDDGVIFISIDDNEQANLKKVCDEIFGIDNCLSVHHIQVRYANKSLNEKKSFQECIEYVLIYSKNICNFIANQPFEQYSLEPFCYEIKELASPQKIEVGGRIVQVFKKEEYEILKHKNGKIGLLKGTWASGSVVKGNASGKYFENYLKPRKIIDGLGVLYKVYGIGEDGLGFRYFTGPNKEDATQGLFYSGVPTERIKDIQAGVSKKYKPITNFYDFSADIGNIRQEGGISFNSGKKPVKMLKQFINYLPVKEGVFMDFFAGSSSMAHAVMQLNAEDGGKRKFIMVQLPEACDEKSEAYKAGYKNICEIGKERIRRAGKKIKEESPLTTQNLDTGFRVLKLDSSNMLDVYYNPDKIEQTSIFDFKDNIKADRSAEDLLFQIMLDMGVTLSAKIEEKEINGTKVFAVDGDFLVACFADNLTDDTLTEIAKLKPRYAAFRDSSFANDSVAKNCEQIFATYSPNTKCTVV